MPAESRHTTRDAALSAGSKGQAANSHFVPVSVSARGKRVQFHQIQGKEPGKWQQFVPSLREGCRHPAWVCGAGSGSPEPLSPPSHLRNTFGIGRLPLFLSLPACCLIFFFPTHKSNENKSSYALRDSIELALTTVGFL